MSVGKPLPLAFPFQIGPKTNGIAPPPKKMRSKKSNWPKKQTNWPKTLIKFGEIIIYKPFAQNYINVRFG
jgi:hypothetical protein